MTNQQYTFDAAGRLQYHPDIHFNHGTPWKTKDEQYLIKYYEKLGPDQLSLDLGRTPHVIGTKAYELRKKGLMKPRTTKQRFKRNVGFK